MSNVWPFPPQSQLKERMEWVTEVIRCRSAEQRLCLRNTPRTTVEYSFQLPPQEVEAATVMARQWGADEFLIPFWHELEHVGTVSPGALSIIVDTTQSRYKAGGKAFIMGSDGKYEVVTIDTVNADSIDLQGPGVVLGFAGAVAMPCFPARFKSPFQFRKYAAEFFTSEAEFIMAEDFDLVAATPYPVFNGSYVLTDRPLIGGNSRESHTREFDGFSNIAGPLYYSTSHTYPVGISLMTWSFDTRAEAWAFRLWMHNVKGKQESFYAPRWTRDFVLAEDALSTDDFLIVETNDFLQDTFTGTVFLQTVSGDQFFLTVDSWQTHLPGTYRMNLNSTLGHAIAAADVELICRMPKTRFNSDVVEFNYKGSGVVEVALPLIEVPE